MTEFTLPPVAFTPGEDVRDDLSGLEGRVHGINYHLSGCIQCMVQPLAKAEDGKMAEAYYIDHESLSSVGEGIKARCTPPGDPLVKLGWEVKDRVSGFSGIVDRILISFNGCINLMLTGKPGKDGKVVHHIVDHKQVERISGGVSEDAKKPVERARTGSISTRAPSRRVER